MIYIGTSVATRQILKIEILYFKGFDRPSPLMDHLRTSGHRVISCLACNVSSTVDKNEVCIF
jgi:hypothetical protein